MADFIKETQGNHQKRNILVAVILAAGTLLTGVLIRYRRKRQLSGSSRPVGKKLLENIKGLSEDEAASRHQPDLDNSLSFKPVRTRQEIWRENILSIFNLSLIGLALVQLLFARPLDALLSIGILGLNIGINVFQENFARLRLKDILQETRPRVTVIRDQATRSIDADEMVIGDMVAFGPGDELFADGVVVHQEKLVIDESMIGNGERRAIKGQGDWVFAGAFCVSGHAVYRVEKTGNDRYITKLIKHSNQNREQLTPIEIIIGNILKILLVVVAFFTIFMIYTYLNIDLPIPVEFFNEVIGIVFSIAPAGLFFMIIVTYAASTVDLAKVGALVHQARSVEAMAQVNTICFSREGVLTGTKLDVELFSQGGEGESIPQNRIQQILGDYARSSTIDNKITRTVRNNFPGSARKTLDQAPYLSIYGWNAINFDDPDLSGTYILGVPAALEPYLKQAEPADEIDKPGKSSRVRNFTSRLGNIFRRSSENQENELENQDQDQNTAHEPDSPTIENLETKDPDDQDAETKEPSIFRRFLTRVSQLAQPDALEEDLSPDEQTDPPIELIFAYYPDPSPLLNEKGQPQFPIPLTPLCKLSFSEQVRPESVPVIKGFHDDGIGVKIFAAEHHTQIIELLKKAGLGEKSLNTIYGSELSMLDAAGLAQAAEDNSIFVHLTPEQMRQVVAALRAKGEYVAMVGDAVNDVPALREANLAASYKGSSPAAQSVADILLLENTLRVLNRVLDKGQRIVNGLLDILKLYLTQVSYLSLIILGIAVLGIGFPLRGIQLTIVTTVTITIPSLGFTLWANPGVLYGNSLRKSLSHFIVPAAITVAIAGIFTFFTFNEEFAERDYTHLAVTYTLVFSGLAVVLFLRPPYRLLAGGAALSQDRRILNMVLVLSVLFFITVALSAAIPFLNDLLLMDWLNPLTDYLIIAGIVIALVVVLLVIWRVWRIPGLEINGETISQEEVQDHSLDHADSDQTEGEYPQLTKI